MRQKLNELGASRTPLFFFLGFDSDCCVVERLDLLGDKALFDIDGFSNFQKPKEQKNCSIKSKTPISFEEYKEKFDRVIEQIKSGNTYVLNLTAPTKIEIEGSLEDVFHASNAKFRVMLKDNLVVFSPERFVSIENRCISTFPMKGTCAFGDDSLARLLASQKEHAEHTMIVDLLRNDISMVATNVRLKNFREALAIDAGGKKLYQTISHVVGDIEDGWQSRLGDILYSITPAGSISGAPKQSTLSIIDGVENYDRGFFSGVFGYFDGEKVDSAVAIRYIEKTQDGYAYKSGGGITLDSDAKSEYEEMIEKVYLPCV